jgi:formylmethanofuran dehydrogenase subunit E
MKTLPEPYRSDGLQHTYETCPSCGEIVSTADIVSLDGRKMCRACLMVAREKAKLRP